VLLAVAVFAAEDVSGAGSHKTDPDFFEGLGRVEKFTKKDLAIVRQNSSVPLS
jgi:hypothetical protein